MKSIPYMLLSTVTTVPPSLSIFPRQVMFTVPQSWVLVPKEYNIYRQLVILIDTFKLYVNNTQSENFDTEILDFTLYVC